MTGESHNISIICGDLVPGVCVKTVTVEKEVFDCAGQIGDLYLFTEVIESAHGRDVRPVGTQFEGVICLKNEATAQLVSCKLFTPRTG